MLPTLFLVKIALTIPGSLWFYINVRINFSISGQNAIGIGRDHIEFIDGCRVLPRAQRGNGGQLPGSRLWSLGCWCQGCTFAFRQLQAEAWADCWYRSRAPTGVVASTSKCEYLWDNPATCEICRGSPGAVLAFGFFSGES